MSGKGIPHQVLLLLIMVLTFLLPKKKKIAWGKIYSASQYKEPKLELVRIILLLSKKLKSKNKKDKERKAMHVRPNMWYILMPF